jgi:hypothetical protein
MRIGAGLSFPEGRLDAPVHRTGGRITISCRDARTGEQPRTSVPARMKPPSFPNQCGPCRMRRRTPQGRSSQMCIIGHRIRGLAIAGVLCLGLSRSAMAQVEDAGAAANVLPVSVTVYRTKQPPTIPASKSETKGPAPSADAVWLAGFWDFQGDRYTAARGGWVWIPGRWLTPPVRDARWDPAHWGWSDGWWSWIPGHWVQRGAHGYPPSVQADEVSQTEIPSYETR